MTTSPPSHVSLTKRDSYGFGVDVARAIADSTNVRLDDDDQDGVIQAFAQDDSQVESSVFPADFANGLREGGETFGRGIIPDSSYGAHLRSPQRGGDQSETGERGEDNPDADDGDTSFAPDRTLDVGQGGPFDSPGITNNGAGASLHASRRTMDRNGYDDDEFGDFIQGAQVSSLSKTRIPADIQRHYQFPFPLTASIFGIFRGLWLFQFSSQYSGEECISRRITSAVGKLSGDSATSGFASPSVFSTHLPR